MSNLSGSILAFVELILIVVAIVLICKEDK